MAFGYFKIKFLLGQAAKPSGTFASTMSNKTAGDPESGVLRRAKRPEVERFESNLMQNVEMGTEILRILAKLRKKTE